MIFADMFWIQTPVPDLDGLVSPSHDLPGADVSDGRRQFSPLKNDVLGDFAVSVDVNAFVVVTHEKLQPRCVGQHHDRMGLDGTCTDNRDESFSTSRARLSYHESRGPSFILNT